METVLGRNALDLCGQFGARQNRFVQIDFFDGMAEGELLVNVARMK